MNFIAENNLDQARYCNNLFILAYDAAKNRQSKTIAEDFQIDAGTGLGQIRAQFHELLRLSSVTDDMLDTIRERLNEEAGKQRVKKSNRPLGPKPRFHLVTIDYFFLVIVFIVSYAVGQTLLDAFLSVAIAAVFYGMTNKHFEAMENRSVTIVETNTSEKPSITFSELCSYGAELIEAHLRYTDSPERPLS